MYKYYTNTLQQTESVAVSINFISQSPATANNDSTKGCHRKQVTGRVAEITATGFDTSTSLLLSLGKFQMYTLSKIKAKQMLQKL